MFRTLGKVLIVCAAAIGFSLTVILFSLLMNELAIDPQLDVPTRGQFFFTFLVPLFLSGWIAVALYGMERGQYIIIGLCLEFIGANGAAYFWSTSVYLLYFAGCTFIAMAMWSAQKPKT